MSDLEIIIIVFGSLHILTQLLRWSASRAFLETLEELAFPSEDPIMTSSLPDFEYEEKTPVNDLEAPEEVILEEPISFGGLSYYDIKESPVIEDAPEAQPHYTKRALRDFKKDQLIEMAKKQSLDTEGTKTELIERIHGSY